MLMSNLSKRIFLIWARAACVLGACGAIGTSVLAAEPAAQGVPLDESRMSPEAALKILLGDAAPGDRTVGRDVVRIRLGHLAEDRAADLHRTQDQDRRRG